MDFVDRSGRRIEPSWASDRPTVYVYPDARDMVHPGDEVCAHSRGCDLRAGHKSGHAREVRVAWQSLESLDESR
jgi:hypothetical protein